MTAFWILAPGVFATVGLCLIVVAFRPQHARLADAIGVLADDAPQVPQIAVGTLPAAERPGAWWVQRRRVVVSATLERQLRLRGRSLTAHYSQKLGLAALGFLIPFVLGLVSWLVAGQIPVLPVLASPLLGLVGFLLPDVLLRSAGREAAEDATESLLTFFDLVTLERLANQSGTQALHAAAALSDSPIFAAIRAALERARLQQRAPYTDLKELGTELDLPALRDLADVMKLDESGAALSTALRARVRELRDAHLSAMKIAASEGSERMTTWMVIPSVVFGLFFLIPPLLKLVGSG